MSDALTMAARSLRLSSRSPDALLTALLLPVMLMVVFVYLFGGAVRIGTSYVTYVTPGVLVLCAVTGASTTAVTVCQDMTAGIVDRFRSLDVPGTAVLAGHVTASLARNLVSTALVAAVAFGLGFRPHASAARFAAAFGVLLLFVAAVSWLAAAFGLVTSAPEAAGAATFILMFFTYASSAFVPVTDHALLAARLRRPPARDPGHRDHPRPAARPARRRAPVGRAGLVRRHRRRLGRGRLAAVPPPHRLIRQPSCRGAGQRRTGAAARAAPVDHRGGCRRRKIVRRGFRGSA
jgi:ABC-2 type transport system permease protein